MPECSTCGGQLRRTKRGLLERFRFRSTFSCSVCGRQHAIARRAMLSRVARCPRCSNTNLRIRRSRDPIDLFLRNPFRLILRFVGAKLYHCQACRLQFYDLRAPAK